MVNEKISVVIPIYNSELYLKKCIDSVVNQTYKNIEVLLVNDGSTDNSLKLCEEYQKYDKRIIIVNKKNGGLVSAWKAGTQKSTGRYICYVDSDDWISKEYIENLVIVLNKYNADVVITHMYAALPNETKTDILDYNREFYEYSDIQNEIYPRMLNSGEFMSRGVHTSRCAKLIKRDLVIGNMEYVDDSVTYAEDLNIIFPVLLDMKSFAVAFSEKCVYFYRANPNSMLRSYNSVMYKSMGFVYHSLLDIVRIKDKQNLRDQVFSDYLASFVQLYKNELLNPRGLDECRKNIVHQIALNDDFKFAYSHTNWKMYRRKLNVIIIKSLIGNNFISYYIVLPILYLAKRINYKLLKLRTKES